MSAKWSSQRNQHENQQANGQNFGCMKSAPEPRYGEEAFFSGLIIEKQSEAFRDGVPIERDFDGGGRGGRAWAGLPDQLAGLTENGSRNIPNIGGNVRDTVCGLGGIRNIFQHIPDTQ